MNDIYAGEIVWIRTVVTDLNGTTILIAPDVTSVTLSISDPTNTSLLLNQALIYNAGFVNLDGSTGAWEYKWQSPAQEGSYRLMIVDLGPNLLRKTYKVLRLKKNPTPFI